MESWHKVYHIESGGRRFNNCIVWSFQSWVCPYGPFSGLGTEKNSVVWQLVCYTGSKVMLRVNFLTLEPRLLLLVAQRLQFTGGLMFLQRLMRNTWAVGTQRDCLSTQSLICGCWRDVFRNWRRQFSVVWTLSTRQNSPSIVSKGRNAVIGWCRDRISAAL